MLARDLLREQICHRQSALKGSVGYNKATNKNLQRGSALCTEDATQNEVRKSTVLLTRKLQKARYELVNA